MFLTIELLCRPERSKFQGTRPNWLLQVYVSLEPTTFNINISKDYSIHVTGKVGGRGLINQLFDFCDQITGEANEQQILSSLQAYPDRASYMTEALRGLFHCSKNWTERKPEVLQVKKKSFIPLNLKCSGNSLPKFRHCVLMSCYN